MILAALQTARDTVAALPDVVKAVLVLPTLSQQLGYICRNTDRLAQIVEQLERVESDTRVLPEMRDEFVVVRRTVVDMQGDTAAMAAGVHDLANVAGPLHGAARRLGRISDRLPERNGRLEPRPPI